MTRRGGRRETRKSSGSTITRNGTMKAVTLINRLSEYPDRRCDCCSFPMKAVISDVCGSEYSERPCFKVVVSYSTALGRGETHETQRFDSLEQAYRHARRMLRGYSGHEARGCG